MSKHKKNSKHNTINKKMNFLNDAIAIESKWQPFDIDLARAILKGMLKGKFVLKNGEYVSISIIDSDTIICHTPYIYDIDDNGLVESQLKIVLNHLGRDEKGYQVLYILVEQDIKQKNIQKEQIFKPFDKVLVRDNEDREWHADLFEKYIDSDSVLDYKYYTINRMPSKYCIPYEGNEHLLGTKNAPKENNY